MDGGHKTGGIALSMDDLRLLIWCASIIEVILEGPKRGDAFGIPNMDADVFLHSIQRIRKALGEPEEIRVERA